MAHTVIGTAGHIDHGKTALVKALTGTDTDRTPEERARGITIELGFAFFGEQATIIDVPGHERFVKTMVAGVSTIDLALLVIAADDGVMPQSREHLDILQLLGVPRGMVVINKVDLVDEEWLGLVEAEVEELVRDSFLEGAPVLRVSALTGEGVDALRRQLADLVARTGEKRREGPFRLPVDRAFLVKGFGLVCTGTVLSGQAGEGDSLEVQPAGRPARVRGLQRHGHPVPGVGSGDRAALNLTGLEAGQVERGDVLVSPGYFRPSAMLDVRLHLLGSGGRALEQRSRVRLHLGTGEVLARVVLLDREKLEPGASGLVQLRLEIPVLAVWGDRFVIRRYSPALTIGGGRVLVPHPDKHRRNDPQALACLAALEGESAEEAIAARLQHLPQVWMPVQELAGELGLGRAQVEAVLARLAQSGRVVRVEVEDQAGAVHAQVWEQLGQGLEEALARFHAEHPLRPGLSREELRHRLDRRLPAGLFVRLLEALTQSGRVSADGSLVRAAAHRIRFTAAEEALRARLEAALREAELAAVPDSQALALRLQADPAQVEKLLRALQRLGAVVGLEGGLFLPMPVVVQVREQLRDYLEAHGQITVSSFRELIRSNRRLAMALLAHFDREGWTERRGDVRVQGEQGR